MARRLPDGLRLFEHLRDQKAPLRLEDLPGHVRGVRPTNVVPIAYLLDDVQRTTRRLFTSR